jgi:hypothetical protein
MLTRARKEVILGFWACFFCVRYDTQRWRFHLEASERASIDAVFYIRYDITFPLVYVGDGDERESRMNTVEDSSVVSMGGEVSEVSEVGKCSETETKLRQARLPLTLIYSH